MSINKNKWFYRWAKKEGLPEMALCIAVEEMALGLFEADLGSGLLSKRIAKQGQGKSSGFRTLVATNRGDRWVFVCGFPNSARSNIDKDEQEALKKLAGQLLGLTPQALATAGTAGELMEISCNEKMKSAIFEAVHETGKGLDDTGVMDQLTMREFDRMCLPPVPPLQPQEIKHLRKTSNVSQAVFAAMLNISLSTIQKWEIGQKRPTGAALKLLHLVQKKGLEIVA